LEEKDVGKTQSVARSAFKVMIGGGLGLTIGLASQVIVASLFGAGAEMDAYLTALVTPAYLQAVLLTGLTFVFIPAFIQENVDRKSDDAWALAGTVINLTTVALIVISALVFLLAPQITNLIAPGLDAEKSALSARMLAILMLAVPPLGVATLTEGLQNARDRFFWAASAPAIGAIGNVLVLLFFNPLLGPLALAWGYVAATYMRLFVTLIPVLRHGWSKTVSLKDSRLVELARLLAPFIFFGLLTRSAPLFERFFASNLPDGDLSFLGYASKISKIMMAMLGQGIAVAAFPAMSRAFSKDGLPGLVEKSEYALRLTLAVALPALAIISALSIPLITTLFQRGAFEASATLSVSRVVPIVLVGSMLIAMLGNVVGRTFYVTRDTRTVQMASSITSLLYIGFASLLTARWGYIGLALATPLHTGIVLIVLIGILIRRIPGFNQTKLLRSLLLYSFAAGLSYLSARSVLALIPSWHPIIQLLSAGSLSAVIYLFIIARVDSEMWQAILEMSGIKQITSKFKKVGVRRNARAITGD
jgi:putative peptidoglycan lipid II flippase